MEKEIEIYWYDLSDEVQEQLLEAGYDDENITSGVFPVTTVFVVEKLKVLLVTQNKYGETETKVLSQTEVLDNIEHDLYYDDVHVIEDALYDATTIEEINEILIDNNLNGKVYPLK